MSHPLTKWKGRSVKVEDGLFHCSSLHGEFDYSGGKDTGMCGDVGGEILELVPCGDSLLIVAENGRFYLTGNGPKDWCITPAKERHAS